MKACRNHTTFAGDARSTTNGPYYLHIGNNTSPGQRVQHNVVLDFLFHHLRWSIPEDDGIGSLIFDADASLHLANLVGDTVIVHCRLSEGGRLNP